MNKEHQAFSSLQGVRVCLLVQSHCDLLTPWSAVTTDLEVNEVSPSAHWDMPV